MGTAVVPTTAFGAYSKATRICCAVFGFERTMYAVPYAPSPIFFNTSMMFQSNLKTTSVRSNSAENTSESPNIKFGSFRVFWMWCASIPAL